MGTRVYEPRKSLPDPRLTNSMQAFTTHTANVAVLDRTNVDTDQVIPKQFLKRIERTGYGRVFVLRLGAS